jgi:hypothetical protein
LNRLFIKVLTPPPESTLTLIEINPSTLPVREVLAHLAQSMGLMEENESGDPWFYWFEKTDGVGRLGENDTLPGVGVDNNSILILRRGTTIPKGDFSFEKVPLDIMDITSAQDLRSRVSISSGHQPSVSRTSIRLPVNKTDSLPVSGQSQVEFEESSSMNKGESETKDSRTSSTQTGMQQFKKISDQDIE